MPGSTKKTGKELERRVADAYRQMGARKVEHDVEMAGSQIDVYVELETPGRLLHRIAVEVKDWSTKPVGIDIVNGFVAIVNLMRNDRLIDEGIIVSATGFSRPARNAAKTYGIRLLEPADLDAMVAEAKAKRRASSAVAGADLKRAILGALHSHSASHQDSPEMTPAELCEAIGLPLDDVEGRKKVRRQLFSLRREGKVEYSSLPDSQYGKVKITLPEDVQATGDDEPTTDPTLDVDTLGPCPAGLGELAHRHPGCARIIQRSELLDEILVFLDHPSKKYHLISLYGQPMVGKTTLLQDLSRVLDNKYAPLIVTMQGIELDNALSSLDTFAFVLAQQLTRWFGEWTKRRGLPDLDSPNRDDFEGKGRAVFESYWHNLLQIAGESRPVVMFDEIEGLLDSYEKLDPQVLTFLDYFVSNHENGYFILVSRELTRRKSRLAEYRGEPFYKLIARGHPIPVCHYSEEAVERILSITKKYFAYEDNALQHFIALCDGQPKILDVMLQEIVRLATGSPDKQRVEIRDIEPIVAEVIKKAIYTLKWMRSCLSEEEHCVVWLISQEVSSPTDEFEYVLPELVKQANRRFPSPSVDHSNVLKEGVADLVSREWIEWRNRYRKLFRFKVGIFPLWFNRRSIRPPDLLTR